MHFSGLFKLLVVERPSKPTDVKALGITMQTSYDSPEMRAAKMKPKKVQILDNEQEPTDIEEGLIFFEGETARVDMAYDAWAGRKLRVELATGKVIQLVIVESYPVFDVSKLKVAEKMNRPHWLVRLDGTKTGPLHTVSLV